MSRSALIGDMFNTIAINNSDFLAGEFNLGVFYSADSGLNWKVKNVGLPCCVNFLYINKDIFWAVISDGKIASSTNKGENWIIKNNGF